MLNIDNLHAYYGKSHVLHGVQFEVGEGEIVALLGRNGSGRSTTAKAIMGMVDWYVEGVEIGTCKLRLRLSLPVRIPTDPRRLPRLRGRADRPGAFRRGVAGRAVRRPALRLAGPDLRG